MQKSNVSFADEPTVQFLLAVLSSGHESFICLHLNLDIQRLQQAQVAKLTFG